MLERIEEVQGIGLLHDVNGKKFRLHKGTLIYSDNGRGKSTLASVFRSAASGDVGSIIERRTIDGTLSPKVVWQFSSGHKVSFFNNVWTEHRPEIMVFDTDFIEKNVHSGGAVSPGHRKNLLDFALGAAAVRVRQIEDGATTKSIALNAQVRQLTAQLAGYHPGLLLAQFNNLTATPDADLQIKALQKQVAAAANASSILIRPIPDVVEEPKLDLNALFAILDTTLENIEDDAEKQVHAHVLTIGVEGAEAWLSSGQDFDNGLNCPYCGQDTSALGLVRAYRTHFNVAYADLKKRVSMLERGVLMRTAPEILDTFSAGIVAANAVASAWNIEVKFDSIVFDKNAAAAPLAALRDLLISLVVQKLRDPTGFASSSDDKMRAEHLWGDVLGMLRSGNSQVTSVKLSIDQFRERLARQNTAQLQSQLQLQISRLEAAKRRHEPIVLNLLKQLAVAKLDAVEADTKKKNAREELDTLMTQTLGKFEVSINALLTKFSANFRIEKMDANFRGGAPRSEYSLQMRGKSVRLEGGVPKFSTALSDGDKRTLAFAFFVATTLAEPDLSVRIVVIDDPMCSLDANRKRHTKTVLKQIHDRAGQLIVLAHDPYFIRDLRDQLMPKGGQSQVSVLQLRHSANGYSDLDEFNVDHECESPYYRHHRTLIEYCEGTCAVQDARSVAKAIRPFLEGYLHRRFPGMVPRGLMFGQVIAFIESVYPPNPVAFAQPLVPELQDINEYAGQFHHDTDPGDMDATPIVGTELRGFAGRALSLVHAGRL